MIYIQEKHEKPQKTAAPPKTLVEEKKGKDKAVGSFGGYSKSQEKKLDMSKSKEEDINAEREKYIGGEDEIVKGFDDLSSDEDD